MSGRLTAKPETVEFLRQLLAIAQESDHPMDKALARVVSKQIGKAEAAEVENAALMDGPVNAYYAD